MTTTAPTQQQHRRTAKRPRPVEQKAEQSADQQESAANASQERDWSRAPEGKMREHVEERIKSLHERLGITPQQEPFWGPVAQAMRDSEARVSSLIQERHENADQMNAVDDLDSFQAIAQAHADGLAKVNLAFKELYDEMPDAQRKNADEVFSRYEGHPGPHGKWKQHRHHKTK